LQRFLDVAGRANGPQANGRVDQPHRYLYLDSAGSAQPDCAHCGNRTGLTGGYVRHGTAEQGADYCSFRRRKQRIGRQEESAFVCAGTSRSAPERSAQEAKNTGDTTRTTTTSETGWLRAADWEGRTGRAPARSHPVSEVVVVRVVSPVFLA